MNRKISFFTIAVIVASILIISCSRKNSVKDKQSQQEFIKVGHIEISGKGLAILDLSFPEVVGFMNEYNSFAKANFSYKYENAWIETLICPDGAEEYYLAVNGIEKDQNGKETCSCYTVYSKLKNEGESLILAPGGDQDSCSGNCCSACELKPADENHTTKWCNCETPVNTPSCQGEAYCNHSTTVTW